MTNPIYKPSGRALEYSPDALALNIYDGCNHGCTYCFARAMASRFGRPWDGTSVLRPGVAEAVKRQLAGGKIRDKLIHLCFSCDPYPADIDTTATREIIRAIKDSRNHVQILTKGGERAMQDFDLLDGGDWFGVTYTQAVNSLARHIEPNAAPPSERLQTLRMAKEYGIHTWVSCEPVFSPPDVYGLLADSDYIDIYRIGKLNHAPSRLDWGAFGREAERLGKVYGREVYIKADLRKEMENP